MIISFNPIIFQSQEEGIQAVLANILVELLMNDKNTHHFISDKSINEIFHNEMREYIFDSNAIFRKHLSPVQQIILKTLISKVRPITQGKRI